MDIIKTAAATVWRKWWMMCALLLGAVSLHAATPEFNPDDAEITNPSLRRFVRLAWGIDIGSSIDMSVQDMSTLNADAYVGLRTPGLDVIGVGAGLHAMVNNNSFSYPVYAIVRTSFSRRPRLCYLEVRGGVSINHLFDAPAQTSFYINPSIGFNLATGTTFRSFLSIGYAYNGASLEAVPDLHPRVTSISMANVRLGIAF